MPALKLNDSVDEVPTAMSLIDKNKAHPNKNTMDYSLDQQIEDTYKTELDEFNLRYKAEENKAKSNTDPTEDVIGLAANMGVLTQ